MKFQPGILFKKNGINKLSFIILGSLAADVTADTLAGSYPFSVILKDSTLSIYSFSTQNAQANSSFNYNLSPHINMTQPEVDYLVTNRSRGVFHGMRTRIDLLNGVTQRYDGEGVCGELFTLGPYQSCTLRFMIDLSIYNPYYGNSQYGTPLVCWESTCAMVTRPDIGSLFSNVIPRLSNSTRVNVTPQWQDGLWYDPASLSIVGTPTRTGVYVFSVSATNDYYSSAPRDLQIDVGINLRDKPVFKTVYNIASAMPEQNYRLNLLELIEPRQGYMVTNQISFGIDTSKEYPAWLSLDGGTILQGHVPPEEAGQQRKVTITAFSNTGGQSEPLTITIPVAYDPAKRPVIDKSVKLAGEAGRLFNSDLRMNIIDPASDSSLKIVMEKIEPPAHWLKVSSYEPTKLEGVIPEESVGIEYQIILHANTGTGGNSDSVSIPFQVAINERLTPHFYAANPQFPMLYEGQAFVYDFVENNDIDPAYSSIPYQIELADGYPNPSWLRVEDNKLIADVVPEHLNQAERLFITIKNLPGGKSGVIALKLFVMN